MSYFFKPLIKTDTKKETYDNKVDFFANEYNEEHWKEYSELFPETDITVDGVSQDVVKPVVHLVGVKWLNTPLTALDGKTAIELEQTEKGSKALRAFVMRLPT